MSETLYVLRQHPDRIPSSLFLDSDVNMDIILLEQGTSIGPSSVKRAVVTTEEIAAGHSRTAMTYDDLVEKIFSSEHIIVL
jgi:hypothetical protein